MSKLAEDIATSGPDAKPIGKAWSSWVFMSLILGWATQNLAAYFNLDQTLATTLLTGALGSVLAVCSFLVTARRHDVRVPDWVVAIAEQIIADAPK